MEGGIILNSRGTLAPPGPAAGTPHAAPSVSPEIKIGKHPTNYAGKDIEVFTMTLGSETIELLPLKTWAQLDLYKWRVRGRLPGTPAGLDVGFDHVRLLGQTVVPQDPEACARLESLFGEWLQMERETTQLTRKIAQQKAAAAAAAAPAATQADAPIRYEVELDKEGQVHIRCAKGKEILTTIGLNVPGFQSLVNQGWLKKPRAIRTGALHDWVELDGTLFSFEKGANVSAELARALNERYIPPSTLGKDKQVVVYANAASSTGFDIQFPAKVGGVLENRRRPLGEESLTLLQDQEHSGLTRKGLVIKLSRPYFIFKEKTPDGGERSLESCDANIVRVADDAGGDKTVDLSQPVSYLKLSAVELTAVFNHPAINPHVRTSPPEAPPVRIPIAGVPVAAPTAQPTAVSAPSMPTPGPSQANPAPAASPAPPVKPLAAPEPIPPAAPSAPAVPATPSRPAIATVAPRPTGPPPNLWLRKALARQPIRFDWFTCLVYEKLAAWAGNSNQGQLLGNECWFIRLSETGAPGDSDFKGVFDTRNGCFGFLHGAAMLRFENNAISLGTLDSCLTAPDVHPVAVGVDEAGTMVFIVSEGYRSRFGTPETELLPKLEQLKPAGAALLSIREALESRLPLQMVWTAPAPESLDAEPEALEHSRP